MSGVGSSGYQFGCTVAAVSARQPLEYDKNDLQNIANEETPQNVEIKELGLSLMRTTSSAFALRTRAGRRDMSAVQIVRSREHLTLDTLCWNSSVAGVRMDVL